MRPLSIRIGLPIPSILNILVLQRFHLSSWSFTTNLSNLLGFLLVFFNFLFFSIFWDKKWVTTNDFFVRSKLGNNKCSLFIMLTKQNLIKVLHSKLVKKNSLFDLLSDPPIKKLCFLQKQKDLFSRATCQVWNPKVLIYFHGWLTLFKLQKNFNKSPYFPEIGLFSWATCSFWNSKVLVYFHG